MHWFWRVLLASCIGFVADILVYAAIGYSQGGSVFGYLAYAFGRWPSLISVVTSSPPILYYMLLTRRLGPQPPVPGESLCRRCAYILRGLREPRCPECGEAI
jgi:hypothetical protein